MKTLLALLLLIPSLSWGLTFKDGKQVDDNISYEIKDDLPDQSDFSIFLLISDEILNQVSTLSVKDKKSSCGFDIGRPSWRQIDKNLPDKIEGYNSRMDNEPKVYGSYARQTFYDFSIAATYIFLTQDEKLKERLFDKLYQWADAKALLKTKKCYNRSLDGKKIVRECEGEWSDPNGQDLAPIKDATVSLEIAIGLNYVYDLLFEDYLVNDPRHQKIQKYFQQWHKRVPYTNEFFWGLQMNWAVPNMLIAKQSGKSYNEMIDKLAKSSNKWINSDGSFKDRTTRGNRALWYHHTAMAEAMMVMELSKAANMDLPDDYEKKYLKAADLFYQAYLDPSYIVPWAKKAHNSQFDPEMPNFQNFPNDLNHVSFEGWWMWVFQYRYPDHPLSKLFKEKLSPYASSIKADKSYGFGIGCIYKTLL